MNWYKSAKSCVEFDDWQIDRLLINQPNLIDEFTGPMDMSKAARLFKLEGDVSIADVEQAKRCLLRMWHPDVNGDNREIATELSQAVNNAAGVLLKNIDDLSLFDNEQSPNFQSNVFEQVTVHTYDGEKDYSKFAEEFADVSNIPFHAMSNEDGDQVLNVIFDTGNELHANWASYGAGIWATGGFDTLDDRNHINLYKHSLKGSAKILAERIMELVAAGVNVVEFHGTSGFYNKTKQHLEDMANNLLIRASSMGSTNWDAVSQSINTTDLNTLAELATMINQEIKVIFQRYLQEYGDKLSNRKMPWSPKYGDYKLRNTFPVMSTLDYFPTWAERLQEGKQTTFDEAGLRERLLESLRGQMENAEKHFPVSNPNNETYQLVAQFYAEVEKVINNLIKLLS